MNSKGERVMQLRWSGYLAAVTVVFQICSMLQGNILHAGDWPFWRGPDQNGTSREKAPVTRWSLEGENLLWKTGEGGRSTPIVMGDRVFYIAPVGDEVTTQERILCVDAETGRTIWEHRFNVFHTDIVYNRVGWTSLVGDPATGYVYAHGTGGEMFCFTRDGVIRWKVSMTEMFGRISGYGGRLHTPIVDEDRVIVSYLNSSWGKHARPLHRYIAFDKHTGAVQWWAAPGGKPLDTTYSTPAVAVIDGVRMLIAANADGNVYGMKARTGERLWTYKLSKRGLNTSMVVDGKYAFVCHSEENLNTTDMGAVVCIDASKRGDLTNDGALWRRDGLTVGYASPVVAKGRLYVINNAANLYCLDAKTGKTIWEYSLGRVGKGSPIVTADGVIYVGEQNGIFHILRDAGEKCVSLDKDVFTHEGGLVDEFYGSPALANGRVYFMSRYGFYCLGEKERSKSATPLPEIPGSSAETVAKNAGASNPGHIQIMPADVTLSPGDSVRFKVMHYNDRGQLTGSDDIPLTPTGIAGKMSSAGTFTASPANVYAAGEILARTGGLESIARVRIIPKLPFTETFDGMTLGKPPPGWIAATKRTRVEEYEGGRVLRKIAPKERPSPPFMRLRTYATQPIAGGYITQCDMLGTPKKRFKPDMGLINSRYRMVMMGRNKLRIESWSPLPRFVHDVPFKWDPNKWYTMKFEIKLEGKHGNMEAVVRGKVWLKDSKEPEEWMIEARDPCPNTEGSAGLYAYSTNTTSKTKGPEVLYDNFQVYRNGGH